MRLLFSHPAGNQNVRAMLAALTEADMLARFSTTLAADPDAAWARLMPAALRRDLLRRRFDLPRDKILQHPWRELARSFAGRFGWRSALRHESGFASIDAVLQDFDRATAHALRGLRRQQAIDAVYAYEDAALCTFEAATSGGLKRIYDLPIAYWETGRKLVQEELERMPAWAATFGGGAIDSPAKLERKVQELAMADLVVVPSQFVADSLPAWAAGKARVLSPFGSPASSTEPPREIDAVRPLRVLFVGSMGQRKGLGDLFAAMQLLKGRNIELVVMGIMLTDEAFYRGQYADFIHERSRPHHEVLALMRSCDVFCLPSLYEGRALVMQEAMSQGLPVVITPNTGGEDLVVEGETGFLVPIRSPEKIAERLAWFDDHRERLPAMKQAAVRHAATYTWQHYGRVVVDAIRTLDHA